MLLISFWTMLIISSTFHYTEATQKPVLTANSTYIRVNEAVKLTCTFTSGTLVQWKYQGQNGKSDIIQSVSAKQDGTCSFDPNPIANVFNQCECSISTNTTCTLKGQTLSNTGDLWQCIVTVGVEEQYSDTVILQVIETTTTKALVDISPAAFAVAIACIVIAAVGLTLITCLMIVFMRGENGCRLCGWKRLNLGDI